MKTATFCISLHPEVSISHPLLIYARHLSPLCPHDSISGRIICDRFHRGSLNSRYSSFSALILTNSYLTCFFSLTVQTAINSNVFVVYGIGVVTELTALVPSILNQLGPDSLASLRKLAESYQAIQATQQRPANAPADDDDDDDVPDLVENFDAVEEKAEGGGPKDTLEELE